MESSADEHWRDYLPFCEFFHAETGAGLGASHQTGWTALVALLLQYGGDLCFDHRQAGLERSAADADASAALKLAATSASPEQNPADPVEITT